MEFQKMKGFFLYIDRGVFVITGAAIKPAWGVAVLFLCFNC